MCGDVKILPGPPNDLDFLHQNVREVFKNFDLVSDLPGNNDTVDMKHSMKHAYNLQTKFQF